jgi:hypothetical protein
MGDLTFGSTWSSSNTRWQMAAPAVQEPFLSVAASSLRLEIKHRFTIHKSCPLFVVIVLLASTFCLPLFVVFNDVFSPNITYLTFVSTVMNLPGSSKGRICLA